MVLNSFGVEVAESELCRLCDSTPSGTDALLAIDAAQQLGFTGTRKYNLALTQLQTLSAAGHHPIVFVDLRPIDNVSEVHALVVIEFDEATVTVLDPLIGERVLSIQTFETAWTMRRRLTILVER